MPAKQKSTKTKKKTRPKASKVLADALLLLKGGKGWIKKHYHNDDYTAFCAMGAVYRIDGPAQDRAVFFLVRIVPGGAVTRYNDLPSTTFKDIASMFKKAIALAKKAGD